MQTAEATVGRIREFNEKLSRPPRLGSVALDAMRRL